MCVDVQIEKVCMGSRKKENEGLDMFLVIACTRLFKKQQESKYYSLCLEVLLCVHCYTRQSCSSACSLQKRCSQGKTESVWQPACLFSSSLHGAACCPTCRSPQKQCCLACRKLKNTTDMQASSVDGKTYT